jgi:hypothetical protein
VQLLEQSIDGQADGVGIREFTVARHADAKLVR